MRRQPTAARGPAAAAALALALGLVAGSALGPAVGSAAALPSSGARTTTVGGALLTTPGVHVHPKAGAKATALPPVDAKSWVVSDADTGEILAAKNAHLPLRPASTLKTLMAVTVLPHLNKQSTYTPVYNDITADGSKVGIVNGSTYTIDQLWYGLFLASGNDTAHALARANGGIAKTVSEMNAEALKLQAFDTVARTPSGLDAPGQHSSAYDLALFSRAGLKMPDFAKYCGTLKVTFPRAGKKAKRKTFMVYNHNPLLLGGYKGAIGVKTGYTVLAGRTFVGAARRGDRTILVTLMDYNGSTYRTSASLLSWGFKNANRVEPVGTLVDPLPPGADPTAARAAAKGQAAPAATAAGGSSGSPMWLFLLIGIALVGAAGWLLRGRIKLPESDPLAAANKGLGKGRSSSSPRGRSGPRNY